MYRISTAYAGRALGFSDRFYYKMARILTDDDFYNREINVSVCKGKNPCLPRCSKKRKRTGICRLNSASFGQHRRIVGQREHMRALTISVQSWA